MFRESFTAETVVQFLQLNISLIVSRRSKDVHLRLDIPFLSTRVSSELIAIVKNFEK